MAKSLEVAIDPEFESLLPRLSDEEFSLLEMSILHEGVRDPLVLWDGVIIDGHNRYKICCEHDIEFDYVEFDIETARGELLQAGEFWQDVDVKGADERAVAAMWISQNQESKRNQQPYQKCLVQMRLEPLIPGRQRGGDRKSEDFKSQNSDNRTPTDRKRVAAARAGVSHDTYAKAKVIRQAVEHGVVDWEVEKRICNGESSIHQVFLQLKAHQRRAEIEKKRKQATRKAKATIAKNDNMVLGDFREVAKSISDDSVELIFTDPPYFTDIVPLYHDLGKIAERILVPGGSMLCYCGHALIPKILAGMADLNLRFYWVCASVQMKSEARMMRSGIVVKWKPILWFVKGGERFGTAEFLNDAVAHEQEKSHHEWQQPLGDASYYIERLTKKNAMVFDPFCGGGTTAVAAATLGRQYMTCDIDTDSLARAKERIANATCGT